MGGAGPDGLPAEPMTHARAPRARETDSVDWETKAPTWEAGFVSWVRDRIFWQTESVASKTGAGTWETDRISWEMESVLWEMESVLWEMESVLWEMESVLWEMESVLWEMESVLWEMESVARGTGRLAPLGVGLVSDRPFGARSAGPFWRWESFPPGGRRPSVGGSEERAEKGAKECHRVAVDIRAAASPHSPFR